MSGVAGGVWYGLWISPPSFPEPEEPPLRSSLRQDGSPKRAQARAKPFPVNTEVDSTISFPWEEEPLRPERRLPWEWEEWEEGEERYSALVGCGSLGREEKHTHPSVTTFSLSFDLNGRGCERNKGGDIAPARAFRRVYWGVP